MSLCNILLLTSSLEPLYGFASNFVWMFLGWTPTKHVKIGVLPLFFMELFVENWSMTTTMPLGTFILNEYSYGFGSKKIYIYNHHLHM